MSSNRKSLMTLRVYRITPAGRRIPLHRESVRLGEPYTRPLTGEWPPCGCRLCKPA
ncbi:hypothetical protein [Streptomyces tateyamensis]|uniref:hypothetical protein n=1 Tax=Streptomyces tateyamensis TaxID=565073 RepID=UPI0015E8E115|nr:hypothetical protein [Streptomyces tateyamensis]